MAKCESLLTIHYMHISESYMEYSQPTFILVTDRAHATLYHAHKREWSTIEVMENDRLTIDDSERYVTGVAADHFSKSEDEKLDDREAKKFYKHLADKLFEQRKKESYERLIICIPAHDKNMLLDELHEYVTQCLDRVVPHQLSKISEQEIIEACDSARKMPN